MAHTYKVFKNVTYSFDVYDASGKLARRMERYDTEEDALASATAATDYFNKTKPDAEAIPRRTARKTLHSTA